MKKFRLIQVLKPGHKRKLYPLSYFKAEINAKEAVPKASSKAPEKTVVAEKKKRGSKSPVIILPFHNTFLLTKMSK